MEVEFKNVSAVTKQGPFVKNISFTVKPGEYIALLGPTGSGPSIILQLLAGKIIPNEGTIWINGKDVTHELPENRSIGYVFERFNLFPHLTVMDNVLYGPKMRAQDLEVKRNVANEIISLVRLNSREDAISKELSGGMQQRVGIARAIVAGSDILLLDQPYRALDAKIRSELRVEVKNIVKTLDITCFHATHETEEAMLTADKIALFKNGSLEVFDTPDNVFNNTDSEFVTTYLAECNEIAIQAVDAEKNSVKIGNLTLIVKATIPNNANKIVIRQHAIEILDNEQNFEGSNIFEGKIVKIRLLGQFIRFIIDVNGVLITVRDILDVRWRNLNNYLNKVVRIWIPEDEIAIY
jgi:ABC-type Fe3+/spermidine/putrescine transport system ATPase subunit